MELQDKLDGVRELHQELTALLESRLVVVEKLCLDLEHHIDEFRKLLDKSPRSEASRQSLASGTARPTKRITRALTD